MKCGKKLLQSACRCGSTNLKVLFASNYPDKDTVQYENLVAMVAAEARDQAGCGVLAVPVTLGIRGYFGIPASRAKKLQEGQAHTQRPDLDNVIKAIEDGLNQVLFTDDSLVWRIEASKHWSATPRAEVEVIY